MRLRNTSKNRLVAPNDGCVKHSDMLACPFCPALITKSETGVNAHLHKHVNSGELSRDDLLNTKLKMMGRTRREATR